MDSRDQSLEGIIAGIASGTLLGTLYEAREFRLRRMFRRKTERLSKPTSPRDRFPWSITTQPDPRNPPVRFATGLLLFAP